MKKLILSFTVVIIFTITTGLINNAPPSFIGYSTQDPYPLSGVLKYRLKDYKDGDSIMLTLSHIIYDLDIENNPRYFVTGIKKSLKSKQIHEIPYQEIEDFEINPDWSNTYCNIFTLDVLNILANTLNDERYRISDYPINANNLRVVFDSNPYWIQISREEAIVSASRGEVVIMSYISSPSGHVAIVRPDSDSNNLYLWNVGSENKEKYIWNIMTSTQYYKLK